MHSYNHGLVTSSKGAAIEFVKLTGLNVAPGATSTSNLVVNDVRSGLLEYARHTATGVYTFQLTLPYPPSLVICQPQLSNADGITDLLHPSYRSASYNATTGQFIVQVTNDDDVGAGVLAAGNATDELHLILVFRRYTT